MGERAVVRCGVVRAAGPLGVEAEHEAALAELGRGGVGDGDSPAPGGSGRAPRTPVQVRFSSKELEGLEALRGRLGASGEEATLSRAIREAVRRGLRELTRVRSRAGKRGGR